MDPQKSITPAPNSHTQTKNYLDNDLPEPATRKSHKPKHEGLRSAFSTLAILIIAPLIALFLTAYVFQSYKVDGPSMEATLQNHDRLIVLKVPRTLSSITGHPYIPHRADVIIFTLHGGEIGGVGQDKQLIKRVIGLPGDRVVVHNGNITVFNKDNPNGFNPDRTFPYGVVITTTSGDINLIVPENEVFVCGDNRANSLDSRSFGTVKAVDIVGKLQFRVYPFKNAEDF